MARSDDWQHEIHEAMRREAWTLDGPNRIIKVVALGRAVATDLRGFICLEKTLLRKTPHQIERVLGLPSGALRAGCRVYRFTRLPMSHEVEYELTALYPDGLAFNPATLEEERAQRRANPRRPRVPIYPPGSSSAHQWKLTVNIPVEHLLDLAPGASYPYLHG